MKTLEELKAIREKTLDQVRLRKDDDQQQARIVVGMATCGIAAGARPVMMAFLEELKKRGMDHVVVTQTGCVGMCTYEPMVDVYIPGEEKITYVKLTPEKAGKIVVEHLANGKPVVEYMIGAQQKEDN